ncbi:MAG: hypothetical protein ACK5IM_02855, partial [Demequina sp.]|uniref:hypothetical protein n=1 Tax=Demequina sp. TaxID=2050685 RepID=UPI003A8382D7
LERAPVLSLRLADGTEVSAERGSQVTLTSATGETEVYRANSIITDGCASDPVDPYQALATDGEMVIVAMGGAGVAVRTAAGEWSQVAVGEFDPVSLDRLKFAANLAWTVLVLSLLAGIATLIVIGVSKAPHKAPALAVVAISAPILLVGELGTLLLLTLDPRTVSMSALVIWCVVVVAFWAGVIGTALTLLRRSKRAAPPGSV